MQVSFGYTGHAFGKNGWVDTSKVYHIPAYNMYSGPHQSLKMCGCSLESIREKLSIGKWREESHRIGMAFKLHQEFSRKGEAEAVAQPIQTDHLEVNSVKVDQVEAKVTQGDHVQTEQVQTSQVQAQSNQIQAAQPQGGPPRRGFTAMQIR